MLAYPGGIVFNLFWGQPFEGKIEALCDAIWWSMMVPRLPSRCNAENTWAIEVLTEKNGTWNCNKEVLKWFKRFFLTLFCQGAQLFVAASQPTNFNLHKILTHQSTGMWEVSKQTKKYEQNPGHMGVCKNNVTPKSSIKRVFHYIHHPFWVFSPYFLKHPYSWIHKP